MSNKFLNGTQSVIQSQFNSFMTNKSSSDSVPNLIAKRDYDNSYDCNNNNCVALSVSGNDYRWVRWNVGDVSNGQTITLPTGNWGGYIWLVYGNGQGRVAVRKYAYKKNTSGFGSFNQIYHYFVGTTDSSISFNSTTGVFTFNLTPSFGSVSGKVFIEYFVV